MPVIVLIHWLLRVSSQSDSYYHCCPVTSSPTAGSLPSNIHNYRASSPGTDPPGLSPYHLQWESPGDTLLTSEELTLGRGWPLGSLFVFFRLKCYLFSILLT